MPGPFIYSREIVGIYLIFICLDGGVGRCTYGPEPPPPLFFSAENTGLFCGSSDGKIGFPQPYHGPGMMALMEKKYTVLPPPYLAKVLYGF